MDYWDMSINFDRWFTGVRTSNTLGLGEATVKNLTKNFTKLEMLTAHALDSVHGDVHLTHTPWDVCRGVIALDPGKSNCAVRKLFGDPAVDLRRALWPALSSLRPNDVVVGIHVHFGDKLLMNFSKLTTDKHQTPESLILHVLGSVGQLFSTLERRSPCGTMRLRIALASDIPRMSEIVQAHYGERLLPGPDAPASHVGFNLGDVYSRPFVKLLTDWFLLALSDVVVQPVPSTFGRSAMLLGMQYIQLTEGDLSFQLRKGAWAVNNFALDAVVHDLCVSM